MARSIIDAHSIVYQVGDEKVPSGSRRIRARLTRKIAKQPGVDLYIRLAYEEAKQQNWDQAQEAIDAALKLIPNHADSMLFQAQILESRGEEEKANQAYYSVVTTHTDFSKAYREYGRFFMKEESTFSTAQTYLLRALELKPKDALAHLLLAEIFYKKGRTSQALLHIEIAKRFQDEEPLFHGRSVPLLLQLEQYDEAMKQLKLAQKHDPKNKWFREQSRELQKTLKNQEQYTNVKPQFWKRWKVK